MKYLGRTSEKNKNSKKVFLFILIFMSIFISGLFLRTEIANLAHYALIPVNASFRYISKPFSNVSVYFSSKTKLENDNFNLSDINKNLEINILSMKAIKDENNELRAMVGMEKANKENRIIAQVILTPPFSPFDTFVAKLSSTEFTDNTTISLVGKPVFIKNSIVGEISETHGSNIIVKLYSNFGNKIPVKINNEIIAEAEGQGGLAFKIVIPKDVEVKKEMPVFSMQQPGIVLGSIKNIEVSETSSFQSLYFHYPFSYSDFNVVEIAI